MGRARDKDAGQASRSGSLRVIKRDGFWHCHGTVRVRDKSERVRRSLGLKDTRPRREAEAAARAEEARVVEILLYGKEATATWAHAAARYLKDRRSGKPNEWRDKERPAVEKLTLIFKHTRLIDIDTGALQRAIDQHYADVGAETKRRVCSTIGGVLSAALRHNLLKHKPHIPRPKNATRQTKVNKWLYPDEIDLLLRCMPEQIRLPVKIMFLQGRRPSEILYRDWSDLDLRSGRERLDLGITKPGEHETIALDKEVVSDLRGLATLRRRQGLPLEGPIFLNARGEPWHNPESRYGLPINKPFRQGRDRAANVLMRASTEAGLDIDRREWLVERAQVLRKVTPYWGRHNFVSHHVAGDTSGQAISEMVGWKSLAMLPRYSHLSDGHLRQAMTRIRLTGAKEGEGGA